MKSKPLIPRLLGRTDRLVAPVIWQLPAQRPAQLEQFQEVLGWCSSVGANWVLLPASISAPEIASYSSVPGLLGDPLRGDASLVIGVDVHELLARSRHPLEDRLAALGRAKCDAVLLEGAVPEDLKAGRPFHRLWQLRDAGYVELLFVEAPDSVAAEWMVEHTPAHAIALPYGIADQSAHYRVLDAARDVGTALLTRRPTRRLWHEPPGAATAELEHADLSLAIGHPAVSAVIEPLPPDRLHLDQVLHAVAHPMPDGERDHWWTRYQQSVLPLDAPPHGPIPEFGA